VPFRCIIPHRPIWALGNESFTFVIAAVASTLISSLSSLCQRNGGFNQILKRQTSPFHYGSKFPAVTITVFITILPVAIILISWNGIFIWETGYWTRAIKRFVLFYLLKSLYSGTKILSKHIVLSWPLSSNSRYKSKNDADEAVSVISLTSSSGGYINGRNSANLE
jgi:hypothetical protein